MIERLPRPQGLLGGSSKDGKMSKLAALAAKRRQKESINQVAVEKSADSLPQDEYAASLSRLSLGSKTSKRHNLKGKTDTTVEITDPSTDEGDNKDQVTESLINETPKDEAIVQRTRPSAFAGIFLHCEDNNSETASINPDILRSTAPVFDFKDPSPDDIVYKAQTGRTR